MKFVTLHKNSFHMSNFKQSGKHELRDMKSMRRTKIAKSVFFNSFSRNIIMPDGFLCVHLFHVRYFLMCINFIKGKKWLNFIWVGVLCVSSPRWRQLLSQVPTDICEKIVKLSCKFSARFCWGWLVAWDLPGNKRAVHSGQNFLLQSRLVMFPGKNVLKWT